MTPYNRCNCNALNKMTNKTKNKGNGTPFEMAFFEWFIVFSLSTGVIAMERLTPLYINNFYIRLILYIIAASLFCFWIGWILFGYAAVRNRTLIFVVVVIACFFNAYLRWGGDWKTQTVLYSHNNGKTIEFQMRGDWYAFGYKKRIVERKKIIPFFDYITDVDTTKLDKSSWKRIDRNVNQLKLKRFIDRPSN